MDLGHYERFIDEDLNRFSNLTTGKVYWNVLTKERRRANIWAKRFRLFRILPMKSNRLSTPCGAKTDADVVITEIGGTIGDIESQPFIEAIRQVSQEVGRDNALFIHVTLVPYIQRQ